MYICVRRSRYVYDCTYVYICIKKCVYTYVWMRLCANLYISVQTCTFVYACVYVCGSLSTCVYMCTYMYICVGMHTHGTGKHLIPSASPDLKIIQCRCFIFLTWKHVRQLFYISNSDRASRSLIKTVFFLRVFHWESSFKHWASEDSKCLCVLVSPFGRFGCECLCVLLSPFRIFWDTFLINFGVKFGSQMDTERHRRQHCTHVCINICKYEYMCIRLSS